jgi:hypothetical protein
VFAFHDSRCFGKIPGPHSQLFNRDGRAQPSWQIMINFHTSGKGLAPLHIVSERILHWCRIRIRAASVVVVVKRPGKGFRRLAKAARRYVEQCHALAMGYSRTMLLG